MTRSPGASVTRDTEAANAMAGRYIDEEIAKAIEAGLDFGVESTCPKAPWRRAGRAREARGYRVEGVYIGTESSAINVGRVERRVASRTGHRADVARLPEDHAVSLSDLREILDQFDELEILTIRRITSIGGLAPSTRSALRMGFVTWEAETLEGWCARWLGR